MQISSDVTTPWPESTETSRLLKRSRDISAVNEDPQETDQSQETGSSCLVQKELTPEEKQRVEFLLNLMAQILAMAEGNLTEEQKSRIREIENEVEKITGIKTHSRLSSMAAQMPGKTDKTDKEEEKEREEKHQLGGIDPKKMEHNNHPVTASEDNPGMQMLRRNALFNSIGALDLNGISSLSS